MKRFLSTITLFVLLTVSLNAQQFYARVGTGFGMKVAGNLDMMYTYDNTSGSQTVTVLPVGLGMGTHINVAFGYMVQKYLGFELGMTQFLGFYNVADSIWRITEGKSLESKMKGNTFYITPAIVLTAGLDKVNPYARIGATIGVASKILIKASYETTDIEDSPAQWEMEEKFYGGIAIGIQAAGGVEWNITDLINLYAEIDFNGISYSPHHSEITTLTKDGTDELSYLTEKQIYTDYYPSIDLADEIPDTSPNEALQKSFPFNSIGGYFGMKFKF